ncbi:MAG: hypothetical protein WAU88_03840 [Candidatus Zixiibacteriota bacterium]
MKTLILVLALAFLVACNGTGPTDDNSIPNSQSIIAGWQYVNWAWGYNHGARYIDRDGNQLAVSYQLADSLWQLAAQEDLTIAQMNLLLSKAQHVSVTIPKDSVRAAAKLARLSASGPYSDTSMVGADMGANEWFGFVFNEDTKMYHRIMLKVDGDWKFENQSASAAKLVAIIENYRLIEAVAK